MGKNVNDHRQPRTDAADPGSGSALADSPGLADKLRDIQLITDAALSRLTPQDLLEVLVDRVRLALQADTAAVLLLDAPSGFLIATAASGLEEEVNQGVRIPVGKGFAGRIAAEGKPIVLDEVDHSKVVNPLLLDKKIRTLMGAPLRSEGSVLGVLHVGTLKPRVFSPQDVDLLQLAADRAALAVEALNAQIDRASAIALQRSLLPSALPAVAGLRMASRFVPGSGNVGGDWYDVFVLPSGQVYAVVGDVAGSGLKAAVIMGRMRSALRAYALDTSDPADMLNRLERKMQHFEPDAMATVMCAVFSADLEQVTIANAGHLPPITLLPGQPATVAPVGSGSMIGIPSPQERQVTTLEMPAGALLCLYTDGLVERRGWPIDDGIEHLCKAIKDSEPEACCAAAMAALADVRPPSDDIALLIIRREQQAAGELVIADPAVRRTNPLATPVRWSGRHAVVTMPAEIDVTTAGDLYDLLASVAAQSPEVVTVDMTGNAFCDSAGLNSLARARRLLMRDNGELRVALGDSPSRRIFELAGLHELIAIFPDVDGSLATARSDSDPRAGSC